MGNTEGRSCTAFEGVRRIASGELQTVALAAKEVLDRGETGPVLIFDDVTSRIVEVEFRGTPEEVRKRLEVTASADRGPEASGPNGDTNIGDTAGAIVPADEPAAAPAG